MLRSPPYQISSIEYADENVGRIVFPIAIDTIRPTCSTELYKGMNSPPVARKYPKSTNHSCVVPLIPQINASVADGGPVSVCGCFGESVPENRGMHEIFSPHEHAWRRVAGLV